MKYFEVKLTITPCTEVAIDVVSALIAEIGFESFVSNEEGVTAYIQQQLFQKELLDETIEQIPLLETKVTYHCNEAEDKNWNEEWEKNSFHPIYVGNNCVIHSVNDTNVDSKEYDIIIDPKLAFGTGHHATTQMLVGEILASDFTNQRVVDAGCGTGILTIASALRGATDIVAYDIDEWSVENTEVNLLLNNIKGIDVRLGDSSVLKTEEPFDIVIANINRNILLQDIPQFAAIMQQGSKLFLSGFYKEDVAILEARAHEFGIRKIKELSCDEWTCIILQR